MDADKTPPGGIAPAEITFAREVQARRKSRGWSQSELADRMQAEGISYANQSTVSRVEQLARPVRMIEAQAIADIFETTLYEMTHEDSLVTDTMEDVRSASDRLAKGYTAYVEACRQLELMRPGVQLAFDSALSRYGNGERLPAEVKTVYKKSMRSIEFMLEVDLARYIPDGWPKHPVVNKTRRRG